MAINRARSLLLPAVLVAAAAAMAIAGGAFTAPAAAQTDARPSIIVNRDLDGDREVVLQWEDVMPTRVLACETLTGADLKAVNSFAEPRRVAAQRLDPSAAGSRMTFKLPPRSYTVVHLAIRA